MSQVERRDEFIELITRHQPQIYSYIYALVNHRDDADELYQQTNIELWKKFDQFSSGTNFVAWACKIAKYKVQNHERRARRSKVYFTDEVLDQLIDTQAKRAVDVVESQRSALTDCLNKLGEQDHKLVELCYFRSVGVRDIARQLGRSRQSVSNSLMRIRRALFECIERTIAAMERHA